MFIVPSVVCRESWNLVFALAMAAGRYRLVRQKKFVLDPRFKRLPGP